MASDATDALAKTYTRNKKLLSLRSITNGLQQTGLRTLQTSQNISLRCWLNLGAIDSLRCFWLKVPLIAALLGAATTAPHIQRTLYRNLVINERRTNRAEEL